MYTNKNRQLFRWDIGQHLIVNGADYVDYTIGENVYRVQAEDGKCAIPDELLQIAGEHVCWTCTDTGTRTEYRFDVHDRPMPPDYVYTPTQRETFDMLVDRVNAATTAANTATANANNATTNADAAKTAANAAAANANAKADLASTAAINADRKATLANTAANTANTAASTANANAEMANTAAASANSAAVNAGEKAMEANAAANAANTAAGYANEKATDAGTAAEAANAAATEANTAAANANAKADLANTAATNANEKASIANTAASNADAKASSANTAAANASAIYNTVKTAYENGDLNGADGSDYVLTSADKAEIAGQINTQLTTDVNALKADMSESVRRTVTDRIIKAEYLGADTPLGYIDASNGNVKSSSSIGYYDMDVEAGESVTVYGYYITSSGLESTHYSKRINAVYSTDAEGNRVAAGCRNYNAGLYEYVVPDGVRHIKFSVSEVKNSYNRNVLVRTLEDGQTTRYLRQRVNGNPLVYHGTLNSGDVVSLGFENVFTNKIWIFSGLIDGEFDSTKIGAYKNGIIRTPYIEVTSDSVNVYSTLGSTFNRSYYHGLTIANDIQIFVEQGRTLFNKKLIVQSNGNRWVCDNQSLRIGEPYWGIGATASCNYSKCTVSAVLKDIDKPVWVFGDSWVSMYDTRWVGQAVSLGLDTGFLLDGHAGRTSAEAVNALKTLIAIKQPKMIVWLMGMNDADTDDSTPNASWLSALTEVKTICTNYDITLILYTIPSVPASQGSYSGTARNNNAKNSYVRNSGYRYVDGVTAMGADTDGNWINGYWQSDTDHTHPSEDGARALMMQVFADVPEMLCD